MRHRPRIVDWDHPSSTARQQDEERGHNIELDTAGHFIVGFVDTFRKVDTMSRMSHPKAARRVRRQFTDEFKAGAVRLVLDEGKTVGAVARELDLTASALADWVRKAQADRTKGRTGLTGVEREELARLRKEVRELRMEREVLKKAAAFFAKDHK